MHIWHVVEMERVTMNRSECNDVTVLHTLAVDFNDEFCSIRILQPNGDVLSGSRCPPSQRKHLKRGFKVWLHATQYQKPVNSAETQNGPQLSSRLSESSRKAQSLLVELVEKVKILMANTVVTGPEARGRVLAASTMRALHTDNNGASLPAALQETCQQLPPSSKVVLSERPGDMLSVHAFTAASENKRSPELISSDEMFQCDVGSTR
ncbi:hypothetical protein DFJ77DRAFT_540402 [Powellomyces hirtus]|nr:hypothetical protein DFJ77DRAFT_540402 [Powellomyces hirtus]